MKDSRLKSQIKIQETRGRGHFQKSFFLYKRFFFLFLKNAIFSPGIGSKRLCVYVCLGVDLLNCSFPRLFYLGLTFKDVASSLI